MTVYDIIILVVMGIFSLWGLWRGIIREAFEAAGLIIGLLAARQFAPGLGAHIPPRAVPQLVRTIAVSIIILLAVYLVVKFVGMLVRKIVRHGPVKSMDRLGGFIIGAVKGALLILALAVIAAFMPFGGKLDSVAGDSPLFGTTTRAMMVRVVGSSSVSSFVSRPRNTRFGATPTDTGTPTRTSTGTAAAKGTSPARPETSTRYGIKARGGSAGMNSLALSGASTPLFNSLGKPLARHSFATSGQGERTLALT